MLPIIFLLALFLPSLALALGDGDVDGEVGTLDRRTLAEITEQQRAVFVKVDFGECLCPLCRGAVERTCRIYD